MYICMYVHVYINIYIYIHIYYINTMIYYVFILYFNECITAFYLPPKNVIL